MIRTFIALASAVALIVGVGACKDNGSDVGNRNSTSQTPGKTDSTSPQGRRGDTLPRSSGSPSSTSPSTTPSTTPSPSGSSDSTGSSSSGSSTTPSSPSSSGSSSGSSTSGGSTR